MLRRKEAEPKQRPATHAGFPFTVAIYQAQHVQNPRAPYCLDQHSFLVGGIMQQDSLLVCVDRIQLPWLKNIRNSLELLTSYSYLRMLISQRGDGSVLKSTWHTNRRGRGQISRARVRLGLAAQVRKPISSRAALLNLWVKTIWWIKGLFHRSRLRLSEISDIYITIHNSSKATVI